MFSQLYLQRKELEREIETRIRIQEKNEELIRELSDALEHIKTLRGIIPICAQCKKMRDDEGYWHQVEEYISVHSEAEFSHGLCVDCVRELYPELADEIIREMESKEQMDKKSVRGGGAEESGDQSTT